MDHRHLCAQAETYLGTVPLAKEAAEDAQLATLDLTLRHHRVQIDELLLCLLSSAISTIGWTGRAGR